VQVHALDQLCREWVSTIVAFRLCWLCGGLNEPGRGDWASSNRLNTRLLCLERCEESISPSFKWWFEIDVAVYPLIQSLCSKLLHPLVQILSALAELCVVAVT